MLNKVILIGNLGEDPKVFAFDNGNRIATVPLATSEKWKDKETGEKKESTTWHNLVFRNKIVDIVEKYLKKGDKIYIEGKISNRSYEGNDGVKKYISEVYVTEFKFLTPTSTAESSKTNPRDYVPDDLPF